MALLAPALDRRRAPVVVDATLGLGGHSEALLRSATRELRLVGLDRDPEALAACAAAARPVRRPHARSCTPSTTSCPTCSPARPAPASQGVLFDLGVSSLQLDDADRGFSYAQDAPLDMRMDADAPGVTAADVVNTYPAERAGPGPARRTARSGSPAGSPTGVVRERERQPFTSTARGSPSWSATPSRRPPGAPAATRPSAPSRRCASRSTASSAALERAMPAAIDALRVGGRIVVLSYHSLEDRLVKQALAAGATSNARRTCRSCPRSSSPAAAAHPRRRDPDAGEIAANPRAASVRLRAAERIREAA